MKPEVDPVKHLIGEGEFLYIAMMKVASRGPATGLSSARPPQHRHRIPARRAPRRVAPPYPIRSRHRDSECVGRHPCARVRLRRPALPYPLEYLPPIAGAGTPQASVDLLSFVSLNSPIIYGLPTRRLHKLCSSGSAEFKTPLQASRSCIACLLTSSDRCKPNQYWSRLRWGAECGSDIDWSHRLMRYRETVKVQRCLM